MKKSYDLTQVVKTKMQEVDRKKKKFPKTAWLDDHDAWDRSAYINETAQEILDVYGEMSDHDQRLIAMLADQLDVYVDCSKMLKEQGVIQEYNKGATLGPSVPFTMRLKALDAAIKIMNELGVTLKARVNNKARPKQESTDLDVLLRGPKG